MKYLIYKDPNNPINPIVLFEKKKFTYEKEIVSNQIGYKKIGEININKNKVINRRMNQFRLEKLKR